MKRMLSRISLRGTLCLLLALCLLGSVLPAAALAAEPEPTVSVYHYMSEEWDPDDNTAAGAYHESSFAWADNWFFLDGEQVDYRLGALSAAAADSSVGYFSDDPADFSKRDKNVLEFLDAMEFEDIETNGWYRMENQVDSAACAVAHKTVVSDGETATLLVILPMSANYRDEWAGNFSVGPEGMHEGFLAARDEVLRFVKQYAAAHDITGGIKVWTAGHSRGAAISNLLGAYFAAGGAAFLENGVTVDAGDVYCYTFSAPATVRASRRRSVSAWRARAAERMPATRRGRPGSMPAQTPPRSASRRTTFSPASTTAARRMTSSRCCRRPSGASPSSAGTSPSILATPR